MDRILSGPAIEIHLPLPEPGSDHAERRRVTSPIRTIMARQSTNFSPVGSRAANKRNAQEGFSVSGIPQDESACTAKRYSQNLLWNARVVEITWTGWRDLKKAGRGQGTGKGEDTTGSTT